MSAHNNPFGDLPDFNDKLTAELRKVAEARNQLLTHFQSFQIGEDIRRAMDVNARLVESLQPAFSQVGQQLSDFTAQLNRVLEPLSQVRFQFSVDPTFKRLLDDLTTPSPLNEAFAALQATIQESHRRTTETLAQNTRFTQFRELVSSFRQWEMPTQLVDAIGSLRTLQESIGTVTLPVIDWSSAATLATLMGEEGIRAQLDALGIRDDGTLPEEKPEFPQQEKGIGLSRKALELMALITFIATFMIPLLQELSARAAQERTHAELAVHRQFLETQAKTLDALSQLVERALERDASYETSTTSSRTHGAPRRYSLQIDDKPRGDESRL